MRRTHHMRQRLCSLHFIGPIPRPATRYANWNLFLTWIITIFNNISLYYRPTYPRMWCPTLTFRLTDRQQSDELESAATDVHTQFLRLSFDVTQELRLDNQPLETLNRVVRRQNKRNKYRAPSWFTGCTHTRCRCSSIGSRPCVHLPPLQSVGCVHRMYSRHICSDFDENAWKSLVARCEGGHISLMGIISHSLCLAFSIHVPHKWCYLLPVKL